MKQHAAYRPARVAAPPPPPAQRQQQRRRTITAPQTGGIAAFRDPSHRARPASDGPDQAARDASAPAPQHHRGAPYRKTRNQVSPPPTASDPDYRQGGSPPHPSTNRWRDHQYPPPVFRQSPPSLLPRRRRAKLPASQLHRRGSHHLSGATAYPPCPTRASAQSWRSLQETTRQIARQSESRHFSDRRQHRASRQLLQAARPSGIRLRRGSYSPHCARYGSAAHQSPYPPFAAGERHGHQSHWFADQSDNPTPSPAAWCG